MKELLKAVREYGIQINRSIVCHGLRKGNSEYRYAPTLYKDARDHVLMNQHLYDEKTIAIAKSVTNLDIDKAIEEFYEECTFPQRKYSRNTTSQSEKEYLLPIL